MEGESQLVQRAQSGDRAAFEEIVRRTSRLVFVRICLETGDPQRAEDLVQETFLTAFKSLHQLVGASGLRPWLTTIAQNVCIDAFRYENRKRRAAPNKQGEDAIRNVAAEGTAPEEKLVLLIGRLVYEKGFQFALEALPEIIERLPNTRFVVAGSGTHEQELRRQAEELGLMEHGTFVGWIGDDVLHSLYRIADVCVVPSIYEPFGLVALEAMASSCPCIVADTGGLREVVPHDEVGLRFRARDPVSLAEMTVRVLDDAKLCRRLTAEAFEHLRRFDWGDVAERTAAVYAELSGRPAAAVDEGPRR